MQYVAMSSSRNRQGSNQNITPPLSFVEPPPTPPSTDEKPSAQASRIIALFHEIRAGKHSNRGPWIEFRLVEGDYDKITRLLSEDEELLGFVEDKVSGYDYDVENCWLVVRLPTAVHESFIARIEDVVLGQLKSIREGSDNAGAFAQKVNPARSTRIYFPIENDLSGRESKHEPDASFWHDRAQYPGVIIEVAYAQKSKRLDRLAQVYLLDSDASVQAVGLDIEYTKKGSRRATLSVWRARVFHTAAENELRVVKEVADEAFRDDQGNATDRPGLRLRLSDFAYEELVQKELGDQYREIHISCQQLCQFLAAAESKVQRTRSLGKHTVAPGVQKRKRSETPPEEIASGDEARYIEREKQAAKRMETQDLNNEDPS